MFVVPEKRRVIQVGDRFGRLTVHHEPFFEEAGLTKDGYVRRRQAAVFACDCGNLLKTTISHVTTGHTVSCGCKKRETIGNRRRTHGNSQIKIYKVWAQMLQRCGNPKDSHFSRYGGRGICVCEEWLVFDTFRDWSFRNGYEIGLTIDRINNDGNYEPPNCRWVTQWEQCRNTSKNRVIVAFSETKIMADWAIDDRCSVSSATIHARLKAGWDAEQAISKPRSR